jgi:hypothetical protein
MKRFSSWRGKLLYNTVNMVQCLIYNRTFITQRSLVKCSHSSGTTYSTILQEMRILHLRCYSVMAAVIYFEISLSQTLQHPHVFTRRYGDTCGNIESRVGSISWQAEQPRYETLSFYIIPHPVFLFETQHHRDRIISPSLSKSPLSWDQ